MSLKFGLHATRTMREWFLLIVLASILPAAITSTLLIYHSYQREYASVERGTLDTARALMQAVDLELSSTQGALEALATSPHLESGDLLLFYVQAKDALRRRPDAVLTLVDISGRQLINTSQAPGAHLPQHPNPALAERVFATGSPVVSDLYFIEDPDRRVRSPMISIDVPVMKDGQIVFDLSMSFPAKRMAMILKRQRINTESPVAIFDSTGVVVSRMPHADRFVGMRGIKPLVSRAEIMREGSFSARTLEGVDAIVAFSRSSVSNWTVSLGVPRAPLLSGLLHSVSWITAATLLLLLAGILFARFAGGHITHCMQVLTASAMALGYGRHVVIPPFNLCEANELGAAMVRAADLLEERTAQRDQAERNEQEIRNVQQKLARSEALQRSMFEEAPDAVLLVSQAGIVLLANAQAEHLFGYSRAQLQSMTIENLVPESSRKRHAGLRQAYFAAPQRRPMGSGMQLMAQCADGSLLAVDIMLNSVHSIEGDFVIAIVRDVTARRLADEALRASEKRFRMTLENAPIGISVVSLEGRWLEVNRALCEMVGYDKAEMLGMTVQEITHPDDVEKDLASVRRQLAGDVRTGQLEKRYIRKDGSIVTVMLTRSLLRDEQGQPLHFISEVEDIGARKAAQDRLTMLNNRLTLATQAGGIAVWELDLRSQSMWWDQRMYALYQITPDSQADLREAWRRHVHPDHVARVERELQEAIRRGEIFDTDFPIVWPNGDARIIRARAILFRDEHGEPAYLTGINWDITDMRKREDAITIALREKETLLKELYHRVKNNLQVVSSLFNLQVRSMPDGAGKTALEEGAARVRAMALVHEKLYQSPDLSSIALEGYIDDLCRQLGNAAAASERHITLVAHTDAIEIGLDTAVPLGLLLNELISNSLQHAFPDNRPGRIEVSTRRAADNELQLCVVDDGVGLPASFNTNFSSSLGLKLINALTAQLNGNFTMHSLHGVSACLTFHLVERTPHAVAQRTGPGAASISLASAPVQGDSE